jgi:hypothetical protein
MKILRRFVLFTFLLAALPAGAETLSSLLSRPPERYPLSNTVEWENRSDPSRPAPVLELLPDVPGAREIRERFLAFKPVITVEQFFWIPLPPGYSAPGENLRLFTRLANIFGNPESQTNYTYHSARRKREIPLFEASYICDSRGRRLAPLSFSVGQMPGNFTYKQYVDEANFSGTVMSQRLLVTAEYFLFSSVNDETLRYSILPVLNRGEMQSELLVYPYGDKLCVYSLTEVKEFRVRQVMGVDIRLDLMFEKRMETGAHWVRDQLGG